jgi:ABC-type branched-subunit amino acid transport system substrate-binding protein
MFFNCAACLGLAAFAAAPAGAEPGVTGKEILIGSCSVLNGPNAELGLRQLEGARAYLAHINGQGGIHGRKLRLLAFDDGYEPGKAMVCFKRLLKEGVFAGAFFVGTPTGARHAFLAEEHRVPVLGFFTGAQLLREPFKRYIINVRASYYDETREQVDRLWNDLGIRRIAVLHQEDAFGAAVLGGVRRALKRYGAAPAAIGSFPRNTGDYAKGLRTVRAVKPEAVVIVGPYKPVAEIVKTAKTAAWEPLFLTVSFVGTESFVRTAGPASEGTVITQVVPPFTRADLPGVALYLELLKRHSPGAEPGFVSLEGFADAMILAEGLKRAGRDLTREKFIDALDSMSGFDPGLGPRLKISLGPQDHQAFDSVYSTVIRGGRAVVLEDWKTLGRIQ